MKLFYDHDKVKKGKRRRELPACDEIEQRATEVLES